MHFFGPNISKMKEERNLQGLLKELKNKDLKIRIDIVKSLCELQHLPGLIEALRNEYPQVRIEAFIGLQNILFDQGAVSEDTRYNVVPELISMLNIEQDDFVWQKAFDAISWLSHYETWLSVGTELLKKDRYKNACMCFERAIDIDPSQKTIGWVGQILSNAKLYDDGASYFDEAIKLDQSAPWAWEGKGFALFNLDRYDEAIDCYKRVLELDQDYALKSARQMLATLYYKKEDFDSALSLVRENLMLNPDNFRHRILFSDLLAIKGNLNEAELEAKKALDMIYKIEYIDGKDLNLVHEQLAIIYFMKGHNDKVPEEFLKAIQADKGNLWTYKLFSAYRVGDVLNSWVGKDPLTRRCMLFSLADRRADDSSIEDIRESYNI